MKLNLKKSILDWIHESVAKINVALVQAYSYENEWTLPFSIIRNIFRFNALEMKIFISKMSYFCSILWVILESSWFSLSYLYHYFLSKSWINSGRLAIGRNMQGSNLDSKFQIQQFWIRTCDLNHCSYEGFRFVIRILYETMNLSWSRITNPFFLAHFTLFMSNEKPSALLILSSWTLSFVGTSPDTLHSISFSQSNGFYKSSFIRRIYNWKNERNSFHKSFLSENIPIYRSNHFFFRIFEFVILFLVFAFELITGYWLLGNWSRWIS